MTTKTKERKSVNPGEGWRLLNEGEPLEPGDGFMTPDLPDVWVDYVCRPDIFKGGGSSGSWYHVEKRDYAHTWPWRRKVADMTTPTKNREVK